MAPVYVKPNRRGVAGVTAAAVAIAALLAALLWPHSHPSHAASKPDPKSSQMTTSTTITVTSTTDTICVYPSSSPPKVTSKH